MARPGLFSHRKFRKLSRLLKSDALAVGHLELMWHTAYEDGEARLGGADEVESAARWKGKRGVLVAALLDSGFIDEMGGGTYAVHDLFAHAPAYVKKRQAREAQRRSSDQSVTSQCPVSDSTLTTTPAPCSLHPLPAPSPNTTTSSDPASPDLDALPRVKPKNGKRPDPELVRLFGLFYEDYPRHEGKQQALKAFLKIAPDRATLLRIADDMDSRINDGRWQPDDPEKCKFIPLPASYLNGRRWED